MSRTPQPKSAATDLARFGSIWDHPAPYPDHAMICMHRNGPPLTAQSPAQNPARPRAGRVCARAVLLAALFAAGCTQKQLTEPVSVPGRNTIQLENLVVLSDFRLPRKHPLLADLEQLRGTVQATLQLPPQRDDVVVYLFSSQEEYRKYLDATYPRLPDRRAYFVGTNHELAVYTFWGERVQEDLRHEYTHGLLHSSLGRVPLWLDEGLAEYFEVAGEKAGGMNSDHAQQLTAALHNGWRPDLARLEKMTEFSQMQKIDYQEAWVWVHYMLHASEDTRQVLVDYLLQLRTGGSEESLRTRLLRVQPEIETRFLAHLASLLTNSVMAHAPQH